MEKDALEILKGLLKMEDSPNPLLRLFTLLGKGDKEEDYLNNEEKPFELFDWQKSLKDLARLIEAGSKGSSLKEFFGDKALEENIIKGLFSLNFKAFQSEDKGLEQKEGKENFVSLESLFFNSSNINDDNIREQKGTKTKEQDSSYGWLLKGEKTLLELEKGFKNSLLNRKPLAEKNSLSQFQRGLEPKAYEDYIAKMEEILRDFSYFENGENKISTSNIIASPLTSQNIVQHLSFNQSFANENLTLENKPENKEQESLSVEELAFALAYGR